MFSLRRRLLQANREKHTALSASANSRLTMKFSGILGGLKFLFPTCKNRRITSKVLWFFWSFVDKFSQCSCSYTDININYIILFQMVTLIFMFFRRIIEQIILFFSCFSLQVAAVIILFPHNIRMLLQKLFLDDIGEFGMYHAA